MSEANKKRLTESEARRLLYCPACGAEKQLGCIVCWGCFKYIDNSLKYSPLSFEDWLEAQAQKPIEKS